MKDKIADIIIASLIANRRDKNMLTKPPQTKAGIANRTVLQIHACHGGRKGRALGLAIKRDIGWAFVAFSHRERPRATVAQDDLGWSDCLPLGYSLDNVYWQGMEEKE